MASFSLGLSVASVIVNFGNSFYCGNNKRKKNNID